MKEKFTELLLSTGRDGMDTVIKNLEKLGFFEAPASTKFHLSMPGGLCIHSVEVCETALKLRETLLATNPSLEEHLMKDSVIIAALLHDVCKAEIYKPYFRNVKNDTTGTWERVPSYEVDYSFFPMGHGEKSVIRLLGWGIKLTSSEMLAIRWHMGAWDLSDGYEAKGNISAAADKCPMVTLLQCADLISSHILEKE